MRNHSETIERPHHRNVGNDVSVGKAERKARIERNDNEKGEERGKKREETKRDQASRCVATLGSAHVNLYHGY